MSNEKQRAALEIRANALERDAKTLYDAVVDSGVKEHLDAFIMRPLDDLRFLLTRSVASPYKEVYTGNGDAHVENRRAAATQLDARHQSIRRP
jgi:hypothetical protein